MGAGETAASVVRSHEVGPFLRPTPRRAPDAGARQPFPELDCIRDRLTATAQAEAALRAGRLGTGADRTLIAMGALDEEAYVRALATQLGLVFAELDDTPRSVCPLSDARLIEAAATGLAPLTGENGIVWLIAPRHLAARGLIDLIGEGKAVAGRFRLTTTQRLDRFALRVADRALSELASDGLQRRWPLLSAAPLRRRRGMSAARAVLVVSLTSVALWAPPLAVEASLALFFLAWLGLRFATALVARPRKLPPLPWPDRELPIYTIIAALYREARSVSGLLHAIERLDYPREKLDVLLAVEHDDGETRAAIAAYAGPLPLRIIVVPPGAPRTKPRALNAALPFARGGLIVVYDAEDRPEPGQLRRAVEAFAANDDRLACVQARLSIDNTDDNWLARMFTAEYAAQFDVFLDGLCALAMPLPLGGSSNHFATATLREIGGWDAWNVTEDADLGLRLARFGYRTAMIDSTTYEEAPSRLMPWLRQRTRWFKGWMQPWCVHMRSPLALWRDLGPRGFIGFQLAVGGNVLAALVHPVFMGALIAGATVGFPIWSTEAKTALAVLYGLSVLTGYLSSAVLGAIGLSRRGLMRSTWMLLLMPAYWLLLSLAAWRAVYQLIVAPYAWEKTEHGLAKHSRRAARLVRSLAALEREVAMLRASGQIVDINRGERRMWGSRARPLGEPRRSVSP